MPSPVADVLLIESGAMLLLLSVRIRVRPASEPKLARCFEKREVARMRIGRVGNCQRTATAVIVGRAARVVFRTPEIRQDAAVVPGSAKILRPRVEAQL